MCRVTHSESDPEAITLNVYAAGVVVIFTDDTLAKRMRLAS